MGNILQLIKLPKRNSEKWTESLKIHVSGVDNAYPNRMERIINGSVTAKASAKLMRKFLKGGGFNIPPEMRNIVVGKIGYINITADMLLNRVARDMSYHYGIGLHRAINANYETAGVSIVPFPDIRLGYMDDNKMVTRIAVYDNWEKDPDKGKFNKEDVQWFDLYTANKEATMYQIRSNWERKYGKKSTPSEAEMVKYFKGQILYHNFDEYGIYPLSPIDAANLDADTEAQISLYKNNDLRSGFMLKHIVKHTEFASEQDRDEFVQQLNGFQGADANGSFMLVQTTIDNQDQTKIGLSDSKEIKFEKIDVSVNDKIWEHYESSCANNIRKSMGNIPPVLIDWVEGKLGNTSGDSIVEAVNFYNQQTQEERDTITELMQRIFSDFHDQRFRDPKLWEITPFNYKI